MIQALIGPVTGLLDKFIEDKDQKNALAHEIATLAEKQAHEAQLAQVEVNKQEAQHRSIFARHNFAPHSTRTAAPKMSYWRVSLHIDDFVVF